jgi:hypothetical protein
MDERARKYVVINPNDESQYYGKPVNDRRYLTNRAAEAAATKLMKKEGHVRFLTGYCLKTN